MSIFSERIKELRTGYGLSQEMFGRVVDVQQQTVYGWEKGRSTPDPETILRICTRFRISSDWLIGLDSQSEPYISQEEVASILAENEPEITENQASWFERLLNSISSLLNGNNAAEEARKINDLFKKFRRKQKEEDTNFDAAVAIRRFAADILFKITKREYSPDVYKYYLKFDVGLQDLWDPSNPKAIEWMEAARQRDAHKWGKHIEAHSEYRFSLPPTSELEAMIEKMVEEQVKRQLKEANADASRAKKVE